MEFLSIDQKSGGVILRAYIQPGASKNEVVGTYGDPLRLKIKIKSPPVDGAANKELLKYASKLFQLKSKDCFLIRGETSRQKDLLLISISIEEAAESIKSMLYT